MNNQRTQEESKKQLKAMPSSKRKALIREKLQAQGLKEGSGVSGKDLSSYDQNEIQEIIQVTSCFPEMQLKRTSQDE